MAGRQSSNDATFYADNDEESTMTDQRPVRACAITQQYEEPPLMTLWETVPRFQGQLLQWVEGSNARDRELRRLHNVVDEDEDDLIHTLIWQDFPTIAAVEAANVALHEAHCFDEVRWWVEGWSKEPAIPTVHARLQRQREQYAEECEPDMKHYRQRMLETLQHYLITREGL
jgi:hypothetical protein